MKKWIIIFISIIVVVVISQSWITYHKTVSYKNKEENTAIKKAEKHDKISSSQISNVTYYNGKTPYHIIRTKKKNKDVYLWVPDTKKGSYIERNVKDGITKNKALSIFYSLKYDTLKVVSVKLGAINDVPIWEVTFLDHQKRYNYVSLTFDDGKEIQHILHI
ncbi:hypothetical protein [Terrilactibacillus laevilacticus]|uniref:DUF5590 domain-containing protein n=1 Tax=Terrilactibacillus laevilacticus TaxID=1380157 RepID=A0ABW5PP54_9BACI|nr:hypothetical protein [Terrilactibacillus laevilacticus]